VVPRVIKDKHGVIFLDCKCEIERPIVFCGGGYMAVLLLKIFVIVLQVTGRLSNLRGELVTE